MAAFNIQIEEKRMNAIEMIKERRSIRTFKDEVVDREIMNEIIGSAVYAPSWANLQIVRYTLVDTRAKVDELAEIGMLGPNVANVKKAPAAVVISYVEGKSGKAPSGGDYVTSKGASWDMFDAGIAAQTFCLAAYEKGVGTVVMGIFNEEKVAEVIGLPEGETVAAVIPYGYETKHPKAAPRMAVEEVTRYV